MEENGDILEKAREEYLKPEVLQIAQNAARVEQEGYCRWTRVEEIMVFARKAGYKKIGLAFCVGLRREAALFNRILNDNGFETVSVACKTGSVPKEFLGLTEEEKLKPGQFEAMCHPVAQAELLNEQNTDLNVILGLCVGHDTLFIRYAKAPVTVLAVKDRVLAHNPLGALYARHYFQRRYCIERKP
ncbi:MAG TPA: DUF1847 domain-containing protein [Bacillota bacterium]|nr:DUF1847 domain-containing protein [Bacillota bacterium]